MIILVWWRRRIKNGKCLYLIFFLLLSKLPNVLVKLSQMDQKHHNSTVEFEISSEDRKQKIGFTVGLSMNRLFCEEVCKANKKHLMHPGLHLVDKSRGTQEKARRNRSADLGIKQWTNRIGRPLSQKEREALKLLKGNSLLLKETTGTTILTFDICCILI